MAWEHHENGYKEKFPVYNKHSINVCWIALEDLDLHPGVREDGTCLTAQVFINCGSVKYSRY
jgi:hypothetical protein